MNQTFCTRRLTSRLDQETVLEAVLRWHQCIERGRDAGALLKLGPKPSWEAPFPQRKCKVFQVSWAVSVCVLCFVLQATCGLWVNEPAESEGTLSSVWIPRHRGALARGRLGLSCRQAPLGKICKSKLRPWMALVMVSSRVLVAVFDPHQEGLKGHVSDMRWRPRRRCLRHWWPDLGAKRSSVEKGQLS